MIDAKSPFTARHSEGVARLRRGRRRGARLQPLVLRDLRRAARLHDIGKLGVSNAILDKPGKLADEESARGARAPALDTSRS